jgi:hypothetical protein
MALNRALPCRSKVVITDSGRCIPYESVGGKLRWRGEHLQDVTKYLRSSRRITDGREDGQARSCPPRAYVSLFTRLSKWAKMGKIHNRMVTVKGLFPSHRYLKER